MSFIDHFNCIIKICLQKNWFSRCQYVPETLMQKNNMGVIGSDMRTKQE